MFTFEVDGLEGVFFAERASSEIHDDIGVFYIITTGFINKEILNNWNINELYSKVNDFKFKY